MNYELFHGDSLEVLKSFQENSIDSIVTDPPYGLAFMAKKWDYSVPSEELWRECLRVLKPGGHLLSFAGTRTQHRMAVRIEDAGFEIRDMIAWVYGSGFPKSMDVSKAIDKAAGAEREVVGKGKAGALSGNSKFNDASVGTISRDHDNPTQGYKLGVAGEYDITAPATEAAKQWQGWGTALKPALEPITVARKPLIGTVASNVLEHGTGAINVDGCRVGNDEISQHGRNDSENRSMPEMNYDKESGRSWNGRWPANFIHDGSDEVVGLFPQSGDSDTAARFFYCAKTSKKDRNEGLEDLGKGQSIGAKGNGLQRVCANCGAKQRFGGCDCPNPTFVNPVRQNFHPTVKPTDLMRYLCRMVTPPGGIVLDPFMGSGSTGKAAVLEGFRFIGIEMEEEYIEIAKARIAHAIMNKIGRAHV